MTKQKSMTTGPADAGGCEARIKVKVPGSTSNLGSGFDTLGIALSISNTVEVALSENGGSQQVPVRIRSAISSAVRPGAEEMLAGVSRVFQEKTGIPAPGVDVWIEGDVPLARGLGSSVTIRLGLLAALGCITGVNPDIKTLGEWVSEIEGHPDNAMPSALGGFCASGWPEGSDRLECLRIELPEEYCFVSLVPTFEVKTEEARRSLPSSYSRNDAVKALNRAAMITGLFCTDQIELLKGFFDDPIHQPYRGRLIPGYTECMRAGVEAGAIGGWISGSGSTLMWLIRGEGTSVGEAVQSVMPDARLHYLRPDNKGLTFLKQNPS